MDTQQLAKDAQMDLLIEVDRICKKWDIPYFLLYGTLIGAVRHDGFIPWDDDIDVGMLRADYDRFKVACEQDLDPEYMLHNWENDPGSPHPFFKLKIRGTHYPEGLAEKANMNDNIYIDIFPYDHSPAARLPRVMQTVGNYLMKKIVLLRCGFNLSRDSVLRKILYGTLCFVSRIRSVEGWKRSLEKLQCRYNQCETEHLVNFSGAYAPSRETIRREWMSDAVYHEFEGMEFPIPVGYDALLRHVYGDYMQLPPEQDRVGRHEVKGIDFGDYVIRFKHVNEDVV